MILAALELKDWLGFTVISALIGAVTSLLVLFLKEFVFARSFENWKRRNALHDMYAKYRDPITLSAVELCSRLFEIIKHYPPTYLDRQLLSESPEQQESNTIDDQYYKHYKLFSTMYRLCAFLGWLEIYRREIVFLDSGHGSSSQRFDNSEEAIRSDLADGQLNNANDWEEWRDILIFREEQRAIGEAMITDHGTKCPVIGYGAFCERAVFDSESVNSWFRSVAAFFVDHDTGTKDFRLTRYKRMAIHLMELIETLDPKRLPAYLRAARSEIAEGTELTGIRE